MKKRTLSRLFLTCTSLLVLSSCSEVMAKQEKDVNILVSANLEGRIAHSTYYDGISSYRKKLLANNSYVSLVDAGNFTYGSYLSSVNNSEEIISLMNKMQYDYAIFGNGDYSYGSTYLTNLTSKADFQFLATNLKHIGEGENKLSSFKKYALVNYGGTKVGYIGLVNPSLFLNNGPRDFMDKDGNYEYEIIHDYSNIRAYYDELQTIIQEIKDKGAQYIIALSSLPLTGKDSVQEHIESTHQIDVVIDGTNEVAEASRLYINDWSQNIPVLSIGKNPQMYGQITLTRGGQLTATLISNYARIDMDVTSYINELSSKYSSELSKVLTSSNNELSIYNNGGARLVDSQENGFANLLADAYKNSLNADVALINSDSIRGSLPNGELNYDALKKSLPYEEKIVLVEATGQQICDALEFASMDTVLPLTDINSKQIEGSSKKFMQVSGLKYSIDTSITSSVSLDNGFFKSVDGERRVKDVKIAKDGSYVDIDLNETYKVATLDRIVNKELLGFNMFNKNNGETFTSDITSLVDYLNNKLVNNVDAYLTSQGRITII